MLDSSLIPTVLAASGGILAWLYTLTQSRSKAQRAELRHRRTLDLERGRYTNDCEQLLANRSIDLPVKRAELVAAEKEEW